MADEDLLDYDEEQAEETPVAAVDEKKKDGKGPGYVSIHSSGFRDFLLKPELLRAIVDCGFEHPSQVKKKNHRGVFDRLFQVQNECIPQAVLGMDVLCQAKSGMGKTAVFVLATLQQLEPVDGNVSVIVMCHTRELAFQISKEYERFSKYMDSMKVAVFFGGMPIEKDKKVLKENCPHIVVGTPGRILGLIRSKALSLKNVKHFVLDECDKMLDALGKRLRNENPPHTQFYSRYATRRPGDLQTDSSRKASNDVLRHSVEGSPTCLQKIHARCK